MTMLSPHILPAFSFLPLDIFNRLAIFSHEFFAVRTMNDISEYLLFDLDAMPE